MEDVGKEEEEKAGGSGRKKGESEGVGESSC